jgi:hypothetical protein
MRCPPLLYLSLLALPCWGADAPFTSQHYQGTAYANKDDSVAYKEEHFVFDQKGVRTRLVLYRCPSGAPFARKWVRNIAGDEAPNFELLDARDGYREGVRGDVNHREAFVQEDSAAPLRTELLPKRARTVIDAGFDAFVRNHWSELAAGDQELIQFVVPSRLEYMEMRIKPAEAASIAGESVQQIKLSLAAWFGFVAPTIELSYAITDRRLVRFKGLSNIHSARGKQHDVRIEFARADIFAAPTQAEIERAAALPLTSECRS